MFDEVPFGEMTPEQAADVRARIARPETVEWADLLGLDPVQLVLLQVAERVALREARAFIAAKEAAA